LESWRKWQWTETRENLDKDGQLGMTTKRIYYHRPITDKAVYRPIGYTVLAVMAIAAFRGCHADTATAACRQMITYAKSFSSPSSGAGSCLVKATGPNFGSDSFMLAGPDRCILSGPVFDGASDIADPSHSESDVERLLDAIVTVESSGRTRAVGDGGQAAGAYQIRPIFLRDVNRILGWNKYKLADRWDPIRSRQMARIYLNHYGKGKTLLDMARQHNGGPDGHTESCTLVYALKVGLLLY
jgi:hypothetical protein